MRFLWPDALWLLLAVPVLIGLYLHALSRRKKSAVRYPSLMLIRAALGPGHRWRRHVPPALFLIATVAALLAAARPSTTFTLPTQHKTIILAIDVSRSMRATDVEPSRIVAAQSAAKTFIEELPSGVRVGIVAFAGTASVVQTPTENRQDLVAAIDRFELQRQTATGSGLLVALALLLPEAGIDVESMIFDGWGRRGGATPLGTRKPDPPKVAPVTPGSYPSGAIVLLSDGRRTTGPDPVDAAKMAADRGVRVYTVGFGTREGGEIEFDGWAAYVRLDEEALKQVAAATGAEYFHAGTAADLHTVYRQLNTKFAMERRETEVSALFSAVAATLVLGAALLSLRWFHRPA